MRDHDKKSRAQRAIERLSDMHQVDPLKTFTNFDLRPNSRSLNKKIMIGTTDAEIDSRNAVVHHNGSKEWQEYQTSHEWNSR